MKLYVDDDAYDVPGDFTYRELALFQRIAGVAPVGLEEAFSAGDPGLIVALAVVSARRQGVELDPEVLFDREAGAIRLEGDEDRPTEPLESDEKLDEE